MTGKSTNNEIQVNDLKTLQLPTNSLCLLSLNELNRDLFCHIKRNLFFSIGPTFNGRPIFSGGYRHLALVRFLY